MGIYCLIFGHKFEEYENTLRNKLLLYTYCLRNNCEAKKDNPLKNRK